MLKGEANFLSKIESEVHYIHIYKLENKLNDTINIIEDRSLEIEGSNRVNKLVLKNQDLYIEGIFIIKDRVSPKYMVLGFEADGPHIKYDKDMNTNIAGLYVAEDCTDKIYQYLK